MNTNKFWMEDDNFQKLYLLLEQGQFELVGYDAHASKQDLKLVYLMNDAAESFLIFDNASVTGTYLPEFDGKYDASLSQDAHGYVLIIHQDETVFTILFQKLRMELHLFDYGKTGHFWVKDWEYLRQLEYRIAILHDKLEYLGCDACTEEEQTLAKLAAFPPLNCSCYPAVSEKYVVPKYPYWYLSDDAAEVMLQLAQEAHDTTLFRWLKLYQKFPARFLARRLAHMFRQIDHAEVVDLLTAKLAQAASVYPHRSFPVSACDPASQQITALYDRAEARRQQLSRKGIHADLLKEEPFQYADDSMEYKVHLMIWNQKGKNRVVEIETFCQ